MPCSSGGYESASYYNDYVEYKDRADRATRAACELGRLLKTVPKLFATLTPRTQKWIKRHEAMDRRRIEQEKEKKRTTKIRQNALAKLSKEERDILGVRKG